MNYNKIILAGNLTRDPQLSYLPSQTAVVDFGLAVNRRYKDKKETCFIDCVGFADTGIVINKYVHKGDPIFIEGRLQFDSWTAEDGTRRSKHKVIVQSVQFLGGKRNNGQAQQQSKVDDADDIPF